MYPGKIEVTINVNYYNPHELHQGMDREKEKKQRSNAEVIQKNIAKGHITHSIAAEKKSGYIFSSYDTLF